MIVRYQNSNYKLIREGCAIYDDVRQCPNRPHSTTAVLWLLSSGASSNQVCINMSQAVVLTLGDVLDEQDYPPEIPPPFEPQRASVLSEKFRQEYVVESKQDSRREFRKNFVSDADLRNYYDMRSRKIVEQKFNYQDIWDHKKPG